MIRSLLAATILCSTMVISAGISSAQVTLDWVDYTRGNSIAVDQQDNVYTVDYVYNPGGDILLTKRDKDGNFQWVATYDNTDNTRWENSTWVATDSADNILVSGDINSGFSNPVKAASILMKFDPAGNLLWRIVYENTFDGTYTKKCLVDANDDIYVLGTGFGAAGYATKVKKFAPNGTAIWSYVDSAGIGLPINFKFTPDGGIVISARSVFGSVNGYAKIDLNGNLLWSFPGIASLTVGDAAGDAAGNSYLVHAENDTNGGTVLKKLSPSGSLLWEYVRNPISGFRVEVGNDNNPVVSGFPNQGTAGAAFLKVSANGTLIWENLDADGPNGFLLHAMMLMDESNSSYLAAGTLFEMGVCKVNSDGTTAWFITTPGAYSNAFTLANTDNSLYVVGGTTVKLGQAPPAGQPPVVSDIPDQSVPRGSRFAPIRADNFVTDPDDPDTSITWTWSGNTALRVTWDSVRRRISVRPPRNWTGSETITFTATDPDGLSDSDPATFTVTASVGGEVLP